MALSVLQTQESDKNTWLSFAVKWLWTRDNLANMDQNVSKFHKKSNVDVLIRATWSCYFWKIVWVSILKRTCLKKLEYIWGHIM